MDNIRAREFGVCCLFIVVCPVSTDGGMIFVLEKNQGTENQALDIILFLKIEGRGEVYNENLKRVFAPSQKWILASVNFGVQLQHAMRSLNQRQIVSVASICNEDIEPKANC